MLLTWHLTLRLLNSKAFAFLLFCTFIIGYLWRCDYTKLTFERPGSIHQWRQCDGASIALTYYQDGNAFWEPKMHNQLGHDGHAAGEFPITYYAASLLYHMFGPKEFILRIIHLFIFLIGLTAFFTYLVHILSTPVLAMVPIALFLSSPTLLFYTHNFLPDGPALGLALLGSAMLLYSKETISHRPLYCGTGVFALAMLIKVSAIIPFVAYLMVQVISSHREKATLDFQTYVRHLILLISATLPSFVWYSYAQWSNEANQSLYFLTKAVPIWSASQAEILGSINGFATEWNNYLWPTFTQFLLLIGLVAFIVFSLRKANFFSNWVWWNIIGMTCYVLLFFDRFQNHDYYFVIVLVLPLFFVSAVMKWLSESKMIGHPALFVVIVLSSGLVSLHSARKSASLFLSSYMAWYDNYTFNENLNSLEPWLDEHGVDKSKKVVCLPDMSPNQSLYLMNRKGWTGLTGIYNSDDADSLIKWGAEYAVITDTSFNTITFLKYHISDTIGYHGNIGVYKIEKSKWADF